MKFYLELDRDKVSEDRIIAVSEDGERIYGVHTSYPEGFTKLHKSHRLPPDYLKSWCRVVNEERARSIMPAIFSWLEKYGINDQGEGTYKEHQFGKEYQV